MLQTNANMFQWYQKINLHEPPTVTASKWWFTVMQICYNYVTLELTWISNTTCHYENFLETNLPIDFCKEFMPNWKMLPNNARISQRHPKHWCFKLMLTCYNDIKSLTYMINCGHFGSFVETDLQLVSASQWCFTVMQICYNFVTLELAWISNMYCHIEHFGETDLHLVVVQGWCLTTM